MGRTGRLLIRFVVSLGLVAFLFSQTGVREVGRTLSSVSPAPVGLAFGTVLLGVLVSALRWRAFLRPLGFHQPLSSLTRLYFVGLFFNAFLPTGVGGDVYKALRLRGYPQPLADAVASVFLDRLAGMLGLAIIGAVATGYGVVVGYRDPVVLIAAGLSIGTVVLTVSAFILRWGTGFLGWIAARWAPVARVERVFRAIEFAGRNPRAASYGLVAGMGFQSLVLLFHWLLARSLGISIHLVVLVAFVILATFAALMPLTVNGLGFREAMYVWALTRYGVSHEVALAFGLLVLALLLVSSAAGGIIYAVRGGGVTGSARPGR